MELRREVLSSEILHPMHGFEPVSTELDLRWDPLTGHAARIVRPLSALLPRADFDLEAFAAETREGCFFCPERIEQVTPRFPEAMVAEGRIRRGAAVLFPNILAYSQYSSVTVYGPELHLLRVAEITPRLMADALATQVDFIRRVVARDPEARWSSVSANHMLPSGSSLFHPHIQSSVDPVPSTMQRLLADAAPRFADYLATERRLGVRHLGSTGSVEWLTAFAPIGFGELRAFLPGASTPEDLSDDRVEELADGLSRALGLYAELGHESFNLALYGAPAEVDGHMLNLRLVARSNLQPLYRSDAAYFERLHWQAMVDTSPEELAERVGDRFRR